MSQGAALAVSNVSHSFGERKALAGVSFTIAPGDFTVLLGLNGAGKTTLFALVTGLYHSRGGGISVYGADMRTNGLKALAKIGAVFQQSTLDLDLTVEQNMFYHAALYGMSRAVAAARIQAELDRVGLADRRKEKARDLSGGQRRRIELARALIHEPSLLLLDEPTVGLDIESRRFLLEHVRSLCAERRMAVLWATHLIDEADDDSKIVVLHKGKVLAAGAARDVIASAGQTDLRTAFDALVASAPEGKGKS
ncbi:MAG TPA: ABC transporter ATP-binding protein [Alphaproteobacteria bacterium]|nr:ABC transporter ATP-binding protein [Alphaproteobacteria bacterium]